MLSRVTKRKWGQRRRSQPRFQASPWDSYRVWILGLVQVRIQERATRNKRRFFFFREKYTPQTESKARGPEICGGQFLQSGSFHRLIRRRIISTVWRKGQVFPGTGSPPTFWPFIVGPSTVMAAESVPFGMLMDYNELITRFQVY